MRYKDLYVELFMHVYFRYDFYNHLISVHISNDMFHHLSKELYIYMYYLGSCYIHNVIS